MSNITIVGLGLIGGSFAKAIGRYTSHTVYGVDRSERVLDDALECGAIHHAIGLDALPVSDFVALALYPDACIRFLRENASRIPKGAIVFDLCGVKQSVCDALMPVAKEYGFHFVGAHPMAGKEQNGFDFSDADLFAGASFLVTPCGADEGAVDAVEKLALSIGFGRVVVTTPQEHDHAIAFTSQLPHVLAAAYVQSPECPKHSGYSAGSYRDVSRVALINEALWPQLFIQNAPALCDEISGLVERLNKMKDAVEQGDEERLREILKHSREIKEIYG